MSLVHLIGKLSNFHAFRIFKNCRSIESSAICQLTLFPYILTSCSQSEDFQCGISSENPATASQQNSHISSAYVTKISVKNVCWHLKINSMVYHLLRARTEKNVFYANKFFKH